MKALSLWQPYASLVAYEFKRNETRSWAIPYRGPIVICAAKTTTCLDLFDQSPFRECLREAGYERKSDLPLGAALCVADLVRICSASVVRDHLGDRERAFGDYKDGRQIWEFANVRRFVHPILMRGEQGLFECKLSLETIERNLVSHDQEN